MVVLEEGGGEEGAKPAAPAAAEPAPAAPAPPPPSPPAAAAPIVAPAAPSTTARKPSIRFPRRVSSTGARISSLPAAAQAAARGDGTDENLLVRLSGGKLYVGRERGTKLSRSRVLTDAEIEQIELGGAA